MTTSRHDASPNSFWQNAASLVTGIFLALCLTKFGNPVIFETYFAAPQDIFEFLYMAWPIQWGYACIVLVLVTALPIANWKKPLAGRWVLASLLIWFAWQFASATQTVDSKLTSATLRHFGACVVCFLIGYFALSEVPRKTFIWVGVLIGLLLMVQGGFRQHFGGLETTRRYFEMYVAPTMTNISPDYLKKISSNRIFGTMFYPNSLAGAILLTTPISAAFLFVVTPARVRRVALGALVGISLAALFWSGSKAGWLLCVLLAGLWVLHSPLPRRMKGYVAIAFVFVGMASFGLKYSGFFQKGATSVIARKDYWRAAIQTVKEHPLFGTGPGTFAVPYAKLKAPEAEMTRLCHNDYLQQASDSGIIGFVAYILFVGGGLFILYRQYSTRFALKAPETRDKLLNFALWSGLFILALHSFVEFHLYIAGLAWPFFLLLGILVRGSKRIGVDKTLVSA